MSNGNDNTQTIEFEGQTHEFPKDFTQEDIRKALESYGKPAQTKAPFSGPTSLTKPDSIVGGFVRRGVSSVKGMVSPPQGTAEEIASGVAGPGGLFAERLGRGAYESFKAKSQAASKDIAKGDYAKAGLHLLETDPTSPIGPLSPAQSQADLLEQHRYREAIGSGLFDALTVLVGSKLIRGPSPEAAAGKLRLATDLHINDIKEVLPELKQTAETGGKPATVADTQNLVRDTTDRLTAEFDRDFAPIMKRRTYTPLIRQRLQKILVDNPQWAKTEEGMAKAQAVKDAIKEYDRAGWTFEEMNKERGDLRTSIRNLENMAPADKRAALRNDADIYARKIVADVMADTVNEAVSQSSGKLKTYYDALRRKQATLIDMEKWLDKRVENLADQQADHKALGMWGRFKFHAYASGSSKGIFRTHISGFREAISPGPEAIANTQVRQAFASSKHPIAGGTVLSLPAETLNMTHGTANPKRRTSITPPPEPSQ
jgi:hypothetical protein